MRSARTKDLGKAVPGQCREAGGRLFSHVSCTSNVGFYSRSNGQLPRVKKRGNLNSNMHFKASSLEYMCVCVYKYIHIYHRVARVDSLISIRGININVKLTAHTANTVARYKGTILVYYLGLFSLPVLCYPEVGTE